MSTARNINGPWMSAEALNRLPRIRREFQLNRDPLIAQQVRDLEKTEKERRDQAEDEGLRRAKKDKPAPALKPPPHMRGNADREGWLTAERDAALARAATRDKSREPTPEQDRTPHQMTRGPSL